MVAALGLVHRWDGSLDSVASLRFALASSRTVPADSTRAIILNAPQFQAVGLVQTFGQPRLHYYSAAPTLFSRRVLVLKCYFYIMHIIY